MNTWKGAEIEGFKHTRKVKVYIIYNHLSEYICKYV